jgi:uncharacterized repeat protein (TIGR03803 family)
MKRFRDRILVLGCAVLASFVSGCGGTSVPASPNVPAFGATVDAPPGHFRLLHSFGNSPDGANPSAGVVSLGGSLYGLTEDGGANGYGTIYSLSVTGKVKVLYSFTGYDGYSPEGELLAYGGLLYGTVPAGFNSFYGGVYSITTSGSFTMLHKFSGVDGINPAAGLIAAGGVLYGTTYQGGAHGVGTLYAMGTTGGEHVVYSFGGYSHDATYPGGSLLFWKNKLWGASNGGGTYNDGTVFSVTTAGKETVLYSFGNGTNGKSPYSSNLTPLDGNLYGTTYEGGTHGVGVVFKVLPSGHVQTVYNFGDNKADGDYPDTGVIAYRNALYGTTTYAGTGNQGTIFRVTPNGKETVLYAFSGDDGSSSYSRLLPQGSNMYGTTFNGGQYGGTGFQGGTAFRFTP